MQECYQDTRAGQWLAKNAPDFGFILRFPKNQQHVTGYIFEPWHYRYLGVGLTQEYSASGAKTLEEFLAPVQHQIILGRVQPALMGLSMAYPRTSL